MRALAAMFVLLVTLATANEVRGQVFELINLHHLNHKLHGEVVDFTHNHGVDHRMYSNALGRPRDLYVYLPPGYDPTKRYPVVIFLHGADVDEHDFLDPRIIKPLDALMHQGDIPPFVIAAPDGTYQGANVINATHSLWVNGLGGRFEDHVVEEVLPFVIGKFAVRADRPGHGLLGVSAGGYGAMAIAIRHRDVFGSVATLAAPLNLLYNNQQGRYGDDFDPTTYCERTEYDRDMIIGRFYGGLLRMRVKTFLEPIYGKGPDMLEKVRLDNPADLLETSDLRGGDLAIYINYPGRDNYNFDAQDKSFAWIAARRGVKIDMSCDERGQHNLPYIRRAVIPAYQWLGAQTLAKPAR